jgi:DNA-binding response OmpR family regulator
MLPDTRGPQLAEEARLLHPESALMYVSGYSTEDLARSGELPAEIELIEKPYEPHELLSRVRGLLDGRVEASVL